MLVSTAAGAPVEIPFDFVDGFILIEARVRDQPVSLLLDSGASASVLSVRTARRLHLAFRGREMVRGVEANATALRCEPVIAMADEAALASIELAIDLSNAAQLCRRPVDGLAGVDFFAGRTVQIDFAARRLRLSPDRTPGPGATRLAIENLNGILCVPVSLNGSQPRPTRLDTGCNDALHWVVPRPTAKASRRQPSIGFLTDTKDAMPGTVQLGDQLLPSVVVSLHARPMFPGEAGLLGTEILSRFLVTVDCKHDEVILESRSTRRSR